MNKKEFKNFKEARKFVKSLNLQSKSSWENYCKSGKKPDNIPYAVRGHYLKKGWISWGDFLGTGNISPTEKKQNYCSFTKAKKFAHSLKLQTREDWRKYCKSGNKPENIPSYPQTIFKNEWTFWGDFLGSGIIGTKDKEFRNFKDAREFVRNLHLNGQKDWNEYRKSGKKPKDIPSAPDKTFKNNGWTNWTDWLGTEDLHIFEKKYRSFTDARKFVHSLKLQNIAEWTRYCKSGKKPKDILMDPRRYPEFTTMVDWIGVKRIGSYKKFGLSWSKAKPLYQKIARENNLKTTSDWLKFVKNNALPKGLPPYPENIYDEFESYFVLLGSNKKFLDFKDAKKIIHSLQILNKDDWTLHIKSGKIPPNIPSSPSSVYKKEWTSWPDWLGNGNISRLEIIPWSDAKKLYRKIAKENNIKTTMQWEKYIKNNSLPKGLAKYPNAVYTKSKVNRRLSK